MKIEGFGGLFSSSPVAAGSPVEKSAGGEVSAVSKKEEEAKLVRSFRLKDALAGNEAVASSRVEDKTDEVTVAAREEFDSAKIATALDVYIAANRPDPMVVAALKAHNASVNGELVVVDVDNKIQYEALQAIRRDLQQALAVEVQNGGLRLTLNLVEQKAEAGSRHLITTQEKLDHLVQTNPLVAEMIGMFALEVE